MNSNFLLAFLLTFFSLCAFSQVSLNLENKIDSIVEHHLEVDKIVGFSVGIVKNGEVLFTKGYGTRTMGEEQPIDSLTNFLTCSISKLFTATAIMQLEEQGKIDLNERLITYLPDFEMKDKRYKEITIHHLLTHTSGLPNFYKHNFIKPAHDSLALQMFADKLKSKKLKFEPGVALSYDTYSNTAYNILGLVIERITGQNYSEYMNQQVLKPVGMTNSSFFYKEIPANRRSTPHKMNFITKQVKVADYYPDIPQDKPCGNLNSCSADLCKWMIHNLSLHHSDGSDEAVIKQETLQKMWTTTERIEGFNTSIGLGWWIVDSEDYGKYLFHVGNDPGFSANLIVSPKNDFGVVVLCNGMYPRFEVWNDVPFEIIDLFKGEWKKD